MKLKLILVLASVLLALTGCSLIGPETGVLSLNIPLEGYPPMSVTLEAIGVSGGQYRWKVEGKTYNQPENELSVVIEKLPCVVTVTWVGDGEPQEATQTIELLNTAPVIGDISFFGIDHTTIVPRTKYIATFDVSDKEGGPIRMVDASVYARGWLQGELWDKSHNYRVGDIANDGIHVYETIIRNRNDEPPSANWRQLGLEEQGTQNTIFCPPFVGENPPKPDVYHVQIGSSEILDNAFMFFSMWSSPLDGASNNMPSIPYYRWAYGYLGCWTSCCPVYWPTRVIPSGPTVITVTFEDEMGARTTKEFKFGTAPFVPVGLQGGIL